MTRCWGETSTTGGVAVGRERRLGRSGARSADAASDPRGGQDREARAQRREGSGLRDRREVEIVDRARAAHVDVHLGDRDQVQVGRQERIDAVAATGG